MDSWGKDTWAMRAAAALRFKQNEHDVFRRLVKNACGELSRDVFRNLAELDRRHVSRLREVAVSPLPDMDEDEAHALRSLVEQAESTCDETGAVGLGADLKRAAYEFYQDLSHLADNAFERGFYLELASEERTSLLSLLDCQEYLTDPSAYFTLKERISLDG